MKGIPAFIVALLAIIGSAIAAIFYGIAWTLGAKYPGKELASMIDIALRYNDKVKYDE